MMMVMIADDVDDDDDINDHLANDCHCHNQARPVAAEVHFQHRVRRPKRTSSPSSIKIIIRQPSLFLALPHPYHHHHPCHPQHPHCHHQVKGSICIHNLNVFSDAGGTRSTLSPSNFLYLPRFIITAVKMMHDYSS